MKLSVDIKNKKGELEADVATLVEKGMEQHERTWKDKFNSKYSAKKEILEIKHKQKIEIEEKKQIRKNWIQKIQENKLKVKQLELEERRRLEKNKEKILIAKIILSIILGTIGIVMMIVGSFKGEESGNPNSAWYALSVFGFLPLISGVFIW